MDEGKYWFEPKRYGYGVGLPVVWQGWLLLLAYVAAVTSAAFWLAEESMTAFLLVLFGTTVPLLLIAARKTRGGLGWRWGNDD